MEFLQWLKSCFCRSEPERRISFFIIKNGQPKKDITLKALFCIFALQMAIGLGSKSSVQFYYFLHAVVSTQYYFLFIILISLLSSIEE